VEVRSRQGAEPFTTLDGSTIRVLLDTVTGGATNQSLAEAELGPGQQTQRHYHARTEEIYVLLEGGGEMELEGDRAEVGVGDAILIPAGARHQITGGQDGARFLCCCAPPYSDEDTVLLEG
jgi:mannose-6-phosphate isomerase-like protein (cupin superfamily)